MLEINKIHLGHTLDLLKLVDDNSIDCCMTSPPYWGLRDYGEQTSTIWNASKDCIHEWDDGHKTEQKSCPKDNEGALFESNTSHYCKKCGAWKGQLGLEPTPGAYIKHLCDIFDEVKRILKSTGTCFVNLGDTYGGSGAGTAEGDWDSKEVYQHPVGSAVTSKMRGTQYDKSLIMIPFRFALEMQKRGWIVRNTIIWQKPNAMPSSATDRFTIDYEYIFFLTKNRNYFFEQQYEPHQLCSIQRACRARTSEKLDSGQYATSWKNDYTGYANMTERLENGELRGVGAEGRNKRCVWSIPTKGFSGAHFATFCEELVETPLKAGCPKGGICLDPFIGSGTVALVALKQGKRFLGTEINPEYLDIANKRIKGWREQTSLEVFSNGTQ
jgi:site-specific DNA-methyltransferase (adenine-specific)